MARAEGVSAIVLAGGRSSRFGRDKLAEPVDGRPLLHHAIDAVGPMASEVIVVVSPDGSSDVPRDVVVVRDARPFDGPLAGLAAGLRGARHAVCLVVGGDSPSLVTGVLELLVAALDDRSIDASALADDERLRPLPAAIRREPGLSAADRLLGEGQRRLRSLFEALPTRMIPRETWRSLDPDGATLRDIDTLADLAAFMRTDPS